jgi:chemotaxis protein methyltransferase CheR
VSVLQDKAQRHDAGVEAIEVDLLLEGIQRHYGFDFSEYAAAPLRRRLRELMRNEGLPTISSLQERILHDPDVMQGVLMTLSVSVTEMFRDPGFYASFRSTVVPLLRTYPFIRIWNAGCSTGEEAYSIAIILAEEGLYERTRIYATDMNQSLIDRARFGSIPLDKMQQYTRNYIESGGKQEFSDYYRVDRHGGRMNGALGDNILFAQHNLVSDGSFNDFNVIMCRNVLIYFNERLQERVHTLFHDSLVRFGVLALGQRESLKFNKFGQRYEELDPGNKIYRRVN